MCSVFTEPTFPFSRNSIQSCNMCPIASVCLPAGLNKNELAKLGKLVQQMFFKSGEYLFHQHDKFDSFYVIQQGSFKKFTLTEDGREQINGFYFPGELIGIDAIDLGQHICSSMAIESSVLCNISFEKFLSLAVTLPSLQLRIIKLMGRQLQHADAIPRNSQAVARLAAFLLNITTRYYRHNSDNKTISLPMSRQEIGNYLGLAIETVSRIFTQLKREAIITTRGKEIRINDFRKLQILACRHFSPKKK